MKPEHDQKLCTDFPILYRDRNNGPRGSCMYFGFSCGDGWFQLLYDLSAKLEAHIVAVRRTVSTDLEFDDRPVASQVKEKFGTLRFCLDNSDPVMDALIEEAEKLSADTCEQCGAPGEWRPGGWVRTLCDGCEAARTKRTF